MNYRTIYEARLRFLLDSGGIDQEEYERRLEEED